MIDIVSIIISILALAISFSTLIYTIYKDNKESIILWCSQFKCTANSNGYMFSGSYIITNNSHKNISIIRAYILYRGTKIPSALDKSNIFPINLNAGQSYPVSVDLQCNMDMYNTPCFELKVVSASQKKYSTNTIYC